MADAAERLRERFTWQDYRGWPDDQRWELVDGEAFAMSPSPTHRHQVVSRELLSSLRDYLAGKPCEPLAAPMDVRLSDADVVQPDILVVCDPTQNKNTHIEGPPALVVEIASPSSNTHDRGRKRALYARSGVKELWLATPYPSLVEVFVLDGESYRVHEVFSREQTLVSPGFPGLEIPLAGVFDFPVKPEERVDEVRESPAPYAAATRTPG